MSYTSAGPFLKARSQVCEGTLGGTSTGIIVYLSQTAEGRHQLLKECRAQDQLDARAQLRALAIRIEGRNRYGLNCVIDPPREGDRGATLQRLMPMHETNR